MAIALAGASFVYGAGMTESGVTFDPVQLVMDDEWIGAIMQFVDGIRVAPETLLLDDIHDVGQFGDYLSLDSTYAHMREQSHPRLMDRRVYEEWQAGGATDMRTRALAVHATRHVLGHWLMPVDEFHLAGRRSPIGGKPRLPRCSMCPPVRRSASMIASGPPERTSRRWRPCAPVHQASKEQP